MNFAPYICIFVSLEINDSFLGKNYDIPFQTSPLASFPKTILLKCRYQLISPIAQKISYNSSLLNFSGTTCNQNLNMLHSPHADAIHASTF